MEDVPANGPSVMYSTLGSRIVEYNTDVPNDLGDNHERVVDHVA
jgi:hypothetical protein